ncbi:zinc-binding dehydrogenase [Streptomyces ginkgonis]|uniref:zinc-binding dehydrogenase n=1 Tax=Streptomyces ginkgonis TaxID=1812259 RepID=UPI002176F00E|nr:zinc-binding dehydrogenase [Streptomyces ginkgonis]
MHAIQLHAYGPPENLRYEEVSDPEPGPGQVRIAVAAAGVHLVDTTLRTAPLPHWPETTLPTIPGREVAGTVDALGPDTDPAWLGRRVVAHLGMVPGGYAERAVTAADRLHHLPDAVPFDRAVAMMGTGRMTMGILRFATLGPEDTVLVLAAAGGIGALLVQYARHRGATVIGAAGGPAKEATVARLGADLAVDYTRDDWADRIRAAHGERPVTRVFEGVGGAYARTAVSLLAPGGAHVSYGYASDPDDTLVIGEEEQRRLGITSEQTLGPALAAKIGGMENIRVLEEESLRHLAAGTLTPLMQRYPLAEAARAHRDLESRATTGKVVLIP